MNGFELILQNVEKYIALTEAEKVFFLFSATGAPVP